MENNYINLINFLIKKGDCAKISEISHELGLSERMTRIVVTETKELLSEKTAIVEESGAGYRWGLTANQEMEDSLRSLERAGILEVVPTTAERWVHSILQILFQEKRVTSRSMMQDYAISQSTAKKDKKDLAEICKIYDLSLNYNQKIGLEISGCEKNIRFMLFSLITENSDWKSLLDPSESNRRYRCRLERKVISKFQLDRMPEVKNKLVEAMNFEGLEFDEVYVEQACLMVMIIKARIDAGYTEKRSSYSGDQLTGTYPKLEKAILKLEELLYGKLPLMERYSVLNALLLSQYVDTKNHRYLNFNWMEVQTKTQLLIERMSHWYGIDFFQFSDLTQMLMKHVDAMVFRAEAGVPVQNPLVQLVKEEYSEIFDACCQVMRQIFSTYDIRSFEDEAAFVAVYFYTFIEKSRIVKERQTNLLVVCGQGISFGNLIIERLDEYFPAMSKKVCAASLLVYSEIQPNTILIKTKNTTLPEYVESALAMVEISPLVDAKDVMEIRKVVTKAQSNSRRASDGEERYKENFRYRKGELMLQDVLSKDHIQLGIQVDNWQEAIEKVAEPLLKNGTIEERYVKAMIESVHKFGPYIVFVKGLALAHARPEEGANSVGVSFATLDRSIEFGNKDFDPVRMMVCLSAVDNESHLQILSNVVEILSDENKIDRLVGMKSTQDFLDFLLDQEALISV